MKILILILSFSLFANITKTISVNGMVCSFCAHGIEKKFKDLKEVESVDVNLEKGKVKLKLKEDISNKKIKKIIIDSGYNVENIK